MLCWDTIIPFYSIQWNEIVDLLESNSSAAKQKRIATNRSVVWGEETITQNFILIAAEVGTKIWFSALWEDNRENTFKVGDVAKTNCC